MNTSHYSQTDALAFTTERLPLAVFLHATAQLTFIGCEPTNRMGKVAFVFSDPHSIGSQLELEFDRGATVTASSLFASQKFLRRLMTETLNIRSIEKRHEHNR